MKRGFKTAQTISFANVRVLGCLSCRNPGCFLHSAAGYTKTKPKSIERSVITEMCRSGYEELGFRSIGHCQISRLVSQNAYGRPVEEEECDFSAELRSEVGSYGAKEDFVRGREDEEDETEHPHVKEVCKLIELRHVWEPKLEKELRCTLRKLTPSQVSAVLQAQEDERVAVNFFLWADRQSRYTHGIGVYYSLLKILSKTKLCQGARRVLKLMIRRGHECLPEAFNYVMISYSRADRLQDAMRVLKLMQIYGCKPDLSTYNTVIHVLVMSNRLDKALKYFNQMQQMGIPPKIITFNILVKGLCQVHRLDEALQLMREMPFRGCPPDEITYNTILSFLCNHRRIDEVRDMLKTMEQNALVPDQTTYSILVHVLSKHGYGQEALDFLMELEDKGFSIDVVGYSAVINAFCGIGKMNEVKYIVNEMFSKGCIPDVATYSTVINGFCRIGRVDEAMRQESCFAIWSERVTILIL